MRERAGAPAYPTQVHAARVPPRTSSPTSRPTCARDLALAPKQLQSKYLYDALGSSLFEAICRSAVVSHHARGARAARIATRPRSSDGASCREPRRAVPLIVELGCGSGEKIVILAEALQSAGGARARRT